MIGLAWQPVKQPRWSGVRQDSDRRAPARTAHAEAISRRNAAAALTFSALSSCKAVGHMGASAYEQACEAIRSRVTLPQLVVFDLDYTLWPFWCEMYSPSDEPRLYPEARAVLEALRCVGYPPGPAARNRCRRCHQSLDAVRRDRGLKLAVASRTPTPRTAEVFMQKLAQKDKAHFPAIQKESGLPFTEMLFFDDEPPNVQKVSRLGVTSILVNTEEGVSIRVLQNGLQHLKTLTAVDKSAA